MEIVLFTLNAIVIYLASDWIMRTLERRRGEAFAHRQVVFFGVFLVLALVSFHFMRRALTG